MQESNSIFEFPDSQNLTELLSLESGTALNPELLWPGVTSDEMFISRESLEEILLNSQKDALSLPLLRLFHPLEIFEETEAVSSEALNKNNLLKKNLLSCESLALINQVKLAEIFKIEVILLTPLGLDKLEEIALDLINKKLPLKDVLLDLSLSGSDMVPRQQLLLTINTLLSISRRLRGDNLQDGNFWDFSFLEGVYFDFFNKSMNNNELTKGTIIKKLLWIRISQAAYSLYRLRLNPKIYDMILKNLEELSKSALTPPTPLPLSFLENDLKPKVPHKIIGEEQATLPLALQRVAELKKISEMAQNELINKHIGLIVSFAKKFQGFNLDIQDLIQEGKIGLIKAIHKYIPQKGILFRSFAGWLIRDAMSRMVLSCGRMVRLPLTFLNETRKTLNAYAHLKETLMRSPTLNEIADYLECPLKKLLKIRNFSQKIISLDSPIDLRVEQYLEENTSQSGFESTEAVFLKFVIRKGLEDFIKQLPNAKMARAVSLRFGFHNGKPQSLQKVGEDLQCSPQNVKFLIDQALTIFRNTKEIQEYHSLFFRK
ncbi:MAG: sigma-70 family RNA polymerase sigma factor [Deltaproteobacteria bacterium]|nr:sigma-70 family RNA polymerase sigma factor [Deltaproteobacteria bacterium]